MRKKSSDDIVVLLSTMTEVRSDIGMLSTQHTIFFMIAVYDHRHLQQEGLRVRSEMRWRAVGKDGKYLRFCVEHASGAACSHPPSELAARAEGARLWLCTAANSNDHFLTTFFSTTMTWTCGDAKLKKWFPRRCHSLLNYLLFGLSNACKLTHISQQDHTTLTPNKPQKKFSRRWNENDYESHGLLNMHA